MDSIPDIEEPGSAWKDIMAYHSVYIIAGRAVEKSSLIKAKIAQSSRLVLFSDFSNKKSDSQAIFLVKLLQKVIYI
jgi:hypothetical protein